MMGINTASLKTKMADPKIRTLVVFVGVLAVALIIYLVSRSNREAIPGVPTVATSPTIPANIESVAGQNPTKEYNALQAEANRRQAEEAIKEGGTAVASILHTEPQAEEAAKPALQQPTGPTPEEVYQRTLAQQQKEDARRQAEAARQQILAQQLKAQQARNDADAKAMGAQAKTLLATWTAVPGQAMNIGPDPREKAAERRAAAEQRREELAKRGGPVLIRAGDILFATLDSEVNTDDGQGVPVLATIVQGPFKGARILGTVTRQEDKAILQFNTMNAPFLQNSIAFTALAVNPDTARAAMASEVNHHYLLRYGSLFAASFIQGWGQSVQDTSAFVTPLGSLEVQKGNQNISARKQIQIGLGQVGESFATQLQPVFNRPPTVVIHSGTGMGILVLQDVRQGVLVDPNQLLAQQQMQATLATLANKQAVPAARSGTSLIPGLPVFATPAATSAVGVVPLAPAVPQQQPVTSP